MAISGQRTSSRTGVLLLIIPFHFLLVHFLLEPIGCSPVPRRFVEREEVSTSKADALEARLNERPAADEAAGLRPFCGRQARAGITAFTR